MNRSPLRWWVCGLLLLATTLNYVDRVALNQTAKRMQLQLGFDERGYARLESGFFITFALGTLAFGWLVDRAGVRRIYPLAVLGWSAAGFATGFADSFFAVLLCRLFLGFFEAGNWPCGIRTTRELLTPAERPLGNSLFQGGTALGAILTPQIVNRFLAGIPEDQPTDAWRTIFYVVGACGIVWILLWILTLPASLFVPQETGEAKKPAPFWHVFRDRRFWILVAVIVGVNVAWHTARIWLPKYLQNSRGYSEREMGNFMSLYYLVADLGSWTVGGLVLLFCWLGLSVHRARLLTFAGCAGLVLVTLTLPNLTDDTLIGAVLLLYGFGALGLFPTYFALSQDLSAAHQGKVTGTLGCINALILSAITEWQGQFIGSTKAYDMVLSLAGLPACVALLTVLIFWRK
jgi:MFS transporter, ACS family, hexuronate transporter